MLPPLCNTKLGWSCIKCCFVRCCVAFEVHTISGLHCEVLLGAFGHHLLCMSRAHVSYIALSPHTLWGHPFAGYDFGQMRMPPEKTMTNMNCALVHFSLCSREVMGFMGSSSNCARSAPAVRMQCIGVPRRFLRFRPLIAAGQGHGVVVDI